MRVKWAFVAVTGGVFLTPSCVPPTVEPANPEEALYLEEVEATPTTFAIPKTEKDACWERANSFVIRFSSMKIMSVTDRVIQTFKPYIGDSGAMATDWEYGYYITYTPGAGDSGSIAVVCMYPEDVGWGKKDQAIREATRNAKMCAYYILTGKVYQKFIYY